MNIALCGFYDQKNFGDDLMCHHLSDVLSQNGLHKVYAYGKMSENIFLNDIIVIGGGGIINQNFWIFKDFNKLKNFKKPIAFINVNITHEIEDTDFLNNLKKLNAAWWVRTIESKSILSTAGIKSNFLPDISFKSHVVKPLRKTSKKLSIFLNYYVFNDLTNKNNVNKFIHALHNCQILASFCDWMVNFGWNITFYSAHVDRDIDDRIPSAFVFGNMKNKSGVKWESESLEWEKLIEEISSSELVISMRFHSSAVAFAAGVPCIDITHHDKNQALIDDIGVEEISVKYLTLSQPALIQAAQYAEYAFEYKEKINIYCTNAHNRWELFKQQWNELI